MHFSLWTPFTNEWWLFLYILILIICCIYSSTFILNRGWLSPDSSRRIVHFLVGIMVSFSPLIFPHKIQPFALAIIFIILNITAFNHRKLKGIHSQDRISYGTLYFPIAYLIIVLGFWDYSHFIIIGFSILALSDPLAASIGTSLRSPSFFIIWYDKKTIQGTIAFFISSFLIIYFGARFLLFYSNTNSLGLALFTALGATCAEITSCKGTDNISIPLVSILFMISYSELINNLDSSNGLITLAILLLILIILGLAYKINALSISGFIGAFIMGVIITLIGSSTYLCIIAVFFLFSSLLGIILKNLSSYKTTDLARNIIQVYANGGVALLICIFDYLHPNPINKFLFFSSIAAAMSDTWGTEFGKLSKKRPISIVSHLPVTQGSSGGITRIGTIGSLLGSCIIGFFTWLLVPTKSIILYGIILCGFLSSIFDSIMGATIQAKYEEKTGEIIESYRNNAILISGISWVNNDMVNLITTLLAPIILYICFYFF